MFDWLFVMSGSQVRPASLRAVLYVNYFSKMLPQRFIKAIGQWERT